MSRGTAGRRELPPARFAKPLASGLHSHLAAQHRGLSCRGIMKITILTYLDKEGDRAHDVVVDQVTAALKETGHQVSILGIHGDVKKLVSGLTRRKPDLIFNLMEMFGDNVFGDIGVAGLLDLLDIPYTGG